MSVMTAQELHFQVDPDNTCPRCLRLKAKMKQAAEVADARATDRFGRSVRRGSPAWKREYYAALGA